MEKEDIIFNLVEKIDEEETITKVEKYKKENRTLIQRNQGRSKVASFEFKKKVKEEDVKVYPRNKEIFYDEEEEEIMAEEIAQSKEEAIANAKTGGATNIHFSRIRTLAKPRPVSKLQKRMESSTSKQAAGNNPLWEEARNKAELAILFSV